MTMKTAKTLIKCETCPTMFTRTSEKGQKRFCPNCLKQRIKQRRHDKHQQKKQSMSKILD
jgi:Zn finger protein HypA/HybF involved in hydrogenase expression